EHDPIVGGPDDRSDRDLWVEIEDEPATRTHEPLAVPVLQDAWLERSGANGAVAEDDVVHRCDAPCKRFPSAAFTNQAFVSRQSSVVTQYTVASSSRQSRSAVPRGVPDDARCSSTGC